MKKLSLIVAMAVILTIGGVFATWTYSGSSVDSQTANAGISITTATTDSTKAGTITATSDVAFSIDNETGDYKTKIDDATGKVTVNFDAAELATDAVKDGVKLQWSVSISGTKSQYEGTTLLTVSDTSKTAIFVEEGTPVEISADAIKAKLSLAEVELKSSEAHASYKTALATYTIVVTVEYVDDSNS